MPRKPDVIRPSLLHMSIPEDVRAKLDLYLFSELEGRVPKGAYQKFFTERIQEFFGWRRMDLALTYYIRWVWILPQRLALTVSLYFIRGLQLVS